MDFPSKNQFRSWLKTKPKEEIVAENWEFCDCPIAKWLNDIGFAEQAYVEPSDIHGRGVWSTTKTGYDRPLPDWASRFGNAVDAENGRAISAAECLRVLNNS